MPINFNGKHTADMKKAMESIKNLRGELDQKRTIINTDSIRRDYKLGQAYRSVRNLDYISIDKQKLQKFADYKLLYKDILQVELVFQEIKRPEFSQDEGYRNTKTALHYPKGNLLILVNKSIYPQVSENINQYIIDVGREGYFATAHTVLGGTPEQIKTYIKNFNPVGVLMVGAVAAAWYKIGNDEFPCDLYYMDTNGIWADSDGDGNYNNHTGHLSPEIWIGRIWTPTKGGNDVNLINDYFKRNHMFRLGQLGHARSALAYVDDDWTGFDDCAMDSMFPASGITKYTNPDTTDADLYKAEVNTLRSWVQLCSHSWTNGHALKTEGKNEYIDHNYFKSVNSPNAHFYNLFCCGPGKFTTPDYIGGWYIFDNLNRGTNHGLTAVASAKSGSMLFFEDFYRPMGQGKVIGDAYLDWWKARGPEHEDWERYWFYGMVLLGDPTLSWWKGAVPQPMQPQSEDVFDHFPRKMQFKWGPVDIPGVRYTVEVDAFGAVKGGCWAEESNKVFRIFHNIAGTTLEHSFVGAQRGRWRVRAIVDGKTCTWSPWSYFRFTV